MYLCGESDGECASVGESDGECASVGDSDGECASVGRVMVSVPLWGE